MTEGKLGECSLPHVYALSTVSSPKLQNFAALGFLFKHTSHLLRDLHPVVFFFPGPVGSAHFTAPGEFGIKDGTLKSSAEMTFVER